MDHLPVLADFLSAVIRIQQSESAPARTATMTAACLAGESCAHGVLNVAGPGGVLGSWIVFKKGSICD